jgi:isobutyryl-CoA mutase
MDVLVKKTETELQSNFEITREMSEKIFVIPPSRTRYLSEIAENNRAYDQFSKEQAAVAQKLFGIFKTIESVTGTAPKMDAAGIALDIEPKTDDQKELVRLLMKEFDRVKKDLNPHNWEALLNWEAKKEQYRGEFYKFMVRDKELKIKTHTESLSHLQIPKIAMPKYEAWGDILRWILQENVPGEFPYTSGLFPFKREGEDPTRMFAGEGGPERTNRRFHYVSLGMPAKRLSTAFDSVTLYGNDPAIRPDIYGKIGNSGVSICCLDDAKKLYSGFHLCDPLTSVSMTINGPAPMLLGFFMNAAIDQECEIYIKANGLEAEVNAKIEAIFKEKGSDPVIKGHCLKETMDLACSFWVLRATKFCPKRFMKAIKTRALSQVRGTVQADILKEDQARIPVFSPQNLPCD